MHFSCASLSILSRGVASQPAPASQGGSSVWAVGQWNAAPAPVNETATQANTASNFASNAAQSTESLPHISTFTPADTVDTAVGLAEQAIDDRWAITKLLATPMENALMFIHETTGLPWWATIIGVTVLVRVALFPLAVTQARGTVAAINAKPEFAALQKQMSDLQASRDTGLTPEEKLYHVTAMRGIARKHGYRAMDMLKGPLIMAPLFLVFFSSLRHMCVRFHESMSVGGTLWFPDLTVVDGYWGLPVISAVTTVVAIHMGAGEMVQTDQSNAMRKLFMVLAPFGALAMGYYMPSAVFLYWCANNILSFVFGRLLVQPTVRAALNIPPMPKQATASLADEVKNMLNRNRAPTESPVTLYKVPPKGRHTVQTIQAKQLQRKYSTVAHAHNYYTQRTWTAR